MSLECGMAKVFGRCARLLRNWRLLNKPDDAMKLENWAEVPEKRSAKSPSITSDLNQRGSLTSRSFMSECILELNNVVQSCNDCSEPGT
jgi:hypothetical protein